MTGILCGENGKLKASYKMGLKQISDHLTQNTIDISFRYITHAT